MARLNKRQRTYRNALLKRGTINHCELNMTADEPVVPGSAWSVLFHASMEICNRYNLPNGLHSAR
jgi:hypothetical protein